MMRNTSGLGPWSLASMNRHIFDFEVRRLTEDFHFSYFLRGNKIAKNR